MINFRFHLISLIAVFLALALGVVMGYGVLGQPTVDTLQGRIDTVEARSNEIRGENDQLRSELSRVEALLESVERFAATNRLADAAVLPVAVRGVDGAKVAETVRLARDAEAAVPGIVWIEDDWRLQDPDEAAELAALVGAEDASRADIREAAAATLATRLATGPPAGRPDILVELADAGFVALEAVDDVEFDATRLDGRASRILLVGGTAADVPLEQAVVPLARALVVAGRIVVVAHEWREEERGEERGVALGAIRDDEALAVQVTTIDNLDTREGPLTTVLVLADRGQGTIGHYGFGDGAERPMPAWWTV